MCVFLFYTFLKDHFFIDLNLFEISIMAPMDQFVTEIIELFIF